MTSNNVITDPIRTCPCCGSTELEVSTTTIKPIPTQQVRCNSCGLIYKRTQEDLTNDYD